MTQADQISWLGFVQTPRLPDDLAIDQWRVRRSSPSQLRDSGRFTLPSLSPFAVKLSGGELARCLGVSIGHAESGGSSDSHQNADGNEPA